MKKITITLFALMVLAQWFIPLRTVFQKESVASGGKTFRFKTQPIDPSDPFRGRYIVLRFEAGTYRADTAIHWIMGETAYVTLEEDGEGFARIGAINRQSPENTTEFVRASTGYVYDDGQLQLELPFSRFYLEESHASQAEQAYWSAATDTTQVTYAEVVVENGNSSLVDVKINGKSIVAIVNELNRTREED